MNDPTESRPEEAGPPGAPDDGEPAEPLQVLVVDDDPELLHATARVLEKEGYAVARAACAQECLTRVDEQAPDLVLLDVVLGDADGAELCRTLKARLTADPPLVVMVSGSRTSSEDQADGLDLGADGYIARPISNRELRSRVRSLARIRRAEKEQARLIAELQAALEKVKLLQGLLPVCSHCRCIRDQEGRWTQIEQYIVERSEATFSHSICPDCLARHYPDLDDDGPDDAGGKPP